ncbi:PREDICTED: protein PHLOEM PROTEIN 2-LIKE A10 isoform X2 [Tarenaya hassleriana]|uniref:protein PHLOEM PROTEIN 2-LIKE A10 isoform X1 n=1 Tax=Tarenaya hassleriana TaxID=28532 RepID=UPI00053C8E2C|nr:PREDICTED: protein PHLOEM PROTEIN 2-LIKE A10 isoform X1 [Tarenaya hassleriana]XP_019058981.1 PREDICTED: protein PHLOEM PROTEIN 2-LIKE A10 isoform X2 [Tarenaya hassleriana]
MDLGLGKKGLDFALRNKKWILLAASGYGALRVYHSPSVSRKRKRISKVLGALLNLVEAASDSAEAISVISKDLTAFLRSDSDQIPNSLKQISKIAKSDEFNSSLIRFTQAMTLGLLHGYRLDSKNDEHGSGFTDRVMDKLFSRAGTGFASAVVGSFARNMVVALCSDEFSGKSSVSESKWVNAICSDESRKLIGDCVQMFVSTAVAVYLDKTMHVNVFDDLFSGMTNPKHERRVKEALISVCNGAVETFVRAARQAPGDSASTRSFGFRKEKTDPEFDLSPPAVGPRLSRRGYSTWINRLSASLSVPSNRRFVIDLTGRITFETIRSLLEILFDKFNNGMASCVESVIETGSEATRYAKVKSSVLYSLCLSLCLQIVEAPWLLAPPNY